MKLKSNQDALGVSGSGYDPESIMTGRLSRIEEAATPDVEENLEE